MAAETEIYHPRAVTDLGLWLVKPLQLKVYGIAASGNVVSQENIAEAKAIAEAELPPRVSAEGQDNGLGFALLHLGETGITHSFYWWVQGCVLCQHIRRTLYGAREPLSSAERPVIGCVWELELINAEQVFWRDTMMIANSDPASYLAARH